MSKGDAPQKGLNKDAHLVRDLFARAKVVQLPTRNGFGEGLVLAGQHDENVVVICADLTESTRALPFKEAFPDRFVQMGVSEQSMASIAAGMAMTHKVPFIASYAAFSPGRNWEQIKTTIALNHLNVKIAGAHAGVSVGPDGATHQMVEDVAIMRVMPNMRVMVPCDSMETKKATVAAALTDGPCYLRFAREKTPVFTTDKTPFKLGRAETFRFGNDATIIAAGPVLYEALCAAEALSRHGIQVRVIDMHTVKPLDVKAVVKAAKETGCIVTIEEAQAAGGLGGAVAETLGAFSPVPLERMGMQDRYGESGEPTDLMEAFGLTARYVEMAVERALRRKKGDRVADIPEYKTAAEEQLASLQKQIMNEALSRTPKRWGGKKPDKSLKSRA